MHLFDISIENGLIITMDEERSIVRNGVLGVKGDTISFVGPSKEISFKALKSIDARGCLVLPGLVNCHTHSAMSLFRGLADDLPLMEWLTRYIFPVESKINGQFVYDGTLLACAEMIMSGTTTFCDMYIFEDQVATAAKEAHMRCLVGEVLYDFPSPNYGDIDKGFEYTEALIDRWKSDPLVSIAVEPHSLYTCSPELLTRAMRIATDHDVPYITHFAETLSEIKEIRERFKKSPLEHLEDLDLLGPNLVGAHCVHLDNGELSRMADSGMKVVNNPESNMKLASGIAPVPEMLSLGITVGLGTDGCASNNNLDLFAEMDMAAKIHKVNTMDPTAADAVTVLAMATIEGARAIGLEGITGSLVKGKKADIIIMDVCKPHLTPMYNPYSQIVYSARGNDIIHSIINGKIVMEDRRLLTLDLERILARSHDLAGKIKSWLS